MYKLVWKREVIEEGITTREEAEYLQQEYTMAYGGTITVKKDK